MLRLALLLLMAALASPVHRALAAASGSSMQASRTPPSVVTSTQGSFNRASYTPAVLYLNAGKGRNNVEDFIDLALIPPTGGLIGRRVTINFKDLRSDLRNLYAMLARQDSIALNDPASPVRKLHRLLIEPISPDLQKLGITTLILVPDPSLQAVPFAALHDGEQSFGERYAFSITPSVSLLRVDQINPGVPSRQLAFGASHFDGLAPLPLVPQELDKVANSQAAERFLNGAFTAESLIDRVGDPAVRRVHLATHAEFLPGGPLSARLYTGTGSMALSRFAALRQRRPGNPLDLFVLSACRTALGDSSSELGFAGLALQAGALSAIGTLWYVDDVATSAFFVQFYRYLNQGLPKAEALQAARRSFARGEVQLRADRLIGADGLPLLENLTQEQQRRVAGGLQHPFFWSGITLLGTPW